MVSGRASAPATSSTATFGSPATTAASSPSVKSRFPEVSVPAVFSDFVPEPVNAIA
jgi:hypothetical protein